MLCDLYSKIQRQRRLQGIGERPGTITTDMVVEQVQVSDSDVRLVTVYLQRAAHKSSRTLARILLLHVTFLHRRYSKVTRDRRSLTLQCAWRTEKDDVLTMPT